MTYVKSRARSCRLKQHAKALRLSRFQCRPCRLVEPRHQVAEEAIKGPKETSFLTAFTQCRPLARPHSSGGLMFDHVKFGVADYAASKAFFLKALEPLGVVVVSEGTPTHGIELSPADGKASLCLYQTAEKPARLHSRLHRLKIASKSKRSIARLWRRVAKTTARPVCARATTPTTTQLSSLVRTGTTSKWSATNPRPVESPQGSELRFGTSSNATVQEQPLGSS